LNWLDILIIFIVGISIFFGVKRGVIKEVFTLLALILGIVIAGRYCHSGAAILGGAIHNQNAANTVSFVLIFSLVVIFFAIIGILLKKLIRLVELGGVDRLGGAAFGLLRGAIIVGVALVFITKYPISGSDTWVQDGSLASSFLCFIEYLWKLIASNVPGSISV